MSGGSEHDSAAAVVNWDSKVTLHVGLNQRWDSSSVVRGQFLDHSIDLGPSYSMSDAAPRPFLGARRWTRGLARFVPEACPHRLGG